jgi:hypothetical protein
MPASSSLTVWLLSNRAADSDHSDLGSRAASMKDCLLFCSQGAALNRPPPPGWAWCDDEVSLVRMERTMARNSLEHRSSLPSKHAAAGTMEAMLDGYGFGLLPSAAAIIFPTAFLEDQHPLPGAPANRARRRSRRYLDRVIGHAVRRGRAWLNHSAENW